MGLNMFMMKSPVFPVSFLAVEIEVRIQCMLFSIRLNTF